MQLRPQSSTQQRETVFTDERSKNSHIVTSERPHLMSCIELKITGCAKISFKCKRDSLPFFEMHYNFSRNLAQLSTAFRLYDVCMVLDDERKHIDCPSLWFDKSRRAPPCCTSSRLLLHFIMDVSSTTLKANPDCAHRRASTLHGKYMNIL